MSFAAVVLIRVCMLFGWPATTVLILRLRYRVMLLGELMAYMRIRVLCLRIPVMNCGQS